MTSGLCGSLTGFTRWRWGGNDDGSTGIPAELWSDDLTAATPAVDGRFFVVLLSLACRTTSAEYAFGMSTLDHVRKIANSLPCPSPN